MTITVTVNQPDILAPELKTGQFIDNAPITQDQQITATVGGVATLDSKLTPDNTLLVTNYQLGSSVLAIDSLFDVSAENPADGSVLLYNDTTKLWEATPQVANPNTIINGGNF